MKRKYYIYILLLSLITVIVGCQSQSPEVQENNQQPLQMNYSDQPNNVSTGTLEKGEKVQEVTNKFNLTSDDVKNRWNSISDGNGSGLYIRELTTNKDSFEYHFSNSLALKGTQSQSGVSAIQITGTPNSEQEAFMMLTAWNQLVLLSNPTFTPDDVTDFFREIRVESGANLQDLQTGDVTFKGNSYHVNHKQGQYTLTAYFS